MTILMKATASAVDYYLTDIGGGVYDDPEITGTDKYFNPKIINVAPIEWQMSKKYGGRVKINLGSFNIFPDGLVNPTTGVSLFPPPRFMDVIVWKIIDGSNVFLFEGTAILGNLAPDQLQYKMYEKELDVDLLDDAPDLGSVTNRVYPLALGVIGLERPLQVGGATDYQYWKAGITETTVGSGVYKIYDNGVEKTLTIDDQTTIFQTITKEVWLNGTSIESGLSEDDTVTVTGTGTPTDYAGVYIVTSTRTNGIKIRLRSSQGYDSYTSGNSANSDTITSVDLIEGKPKGDVLLSGTGADTTLIDFFDWAKDRINTELTTSYTLDSSAASSVSISGYEAGQKNLLDFMDFIASACNHWFYIDEDSATIYLGDMQNDNGTLTLDNYGFFAAGYNYANPVKTTVYEWQEPALSIDDQDYPIVINRKQEQQINTDVPVGRERVKLPVYHRVLANVITQLTNSTTSLQSPDVVIDMKFQTGIVPGLKITFTDSKHIGTPTIEMRVRTLQYDPSGETMRVGGNAV